MPHSHSARSRRHGCLVVAREAMVADAEMWLDGKPTIIVAHGRPKNARMDERDVLAAARETQGLERMDHITFAVLETSGGISIIPR